MTDGSPPAAINDLGKFSFRLNVDRRKMLVIAIGVEGFDTQEVEAALLQHELDAPQPATWA